jgi:phosphatidylserine/phosphatidylglycerophosphate/cardiolipin synthase-like enzyme
MTRLLTSLLIITLLVGCGPASDAELLELDPSLSAEQLELRRRDFCTMTGARTAPLEVFAHPQAGEDPYLAVINGATRSLRIMVYEFNSETIREAVRAKAAAGVDVHVILDATKAPTNQATFDVLTAAGAKVQWSDPVFTYTHAKFIVADEGVALISSGNLDHYMRSGRNFGAVDRDLGDVRTLVKIFDADFAHVVPSITCTRLLLSPINSKERHLELITSATKTLEIESMQFSDADIRAAVLARQQAGVAVRVLLASPTWITANDYAGRWLKDRGIPARWRSSPSVHVKAITVDGKTAYLGSVNLSTTSLTQNREVGLVTTEADDLGLMSSTFEQDWATARDF